MNPSRMAHTKKPPNSMVVIGISSDSSSSADSSDSSDFDDSVICRKRSRSPNAVDESFRSLKTPKQELDSGVVLPPGFLSALPPEDAVPLQKIGPKHVSMAESDRLPDTMVEDAQSAQVIGSRKQFWKAGDYVEGNCMRLTPCSVGMDRARIHPKFLHSNATSHKWALGALAELLDNSMDETCNGATYVCVDMLQNKKDGSKMLLVQDDGGGMTPDKMRKCMSFGYSLKSKDATTIGQYGNGFKTSAMRVGADVIVFSRSPQSASTSFLSSTQSIGMLSYTFLMSTGKEDVIVPMIDYHKDGKSWNKTKFSSLHDWNRNLESITQWSPFSSEEDLLLQFDFLKNRGTRIIIYNLWEDDEGNLELDFDSDPHDIQIRGANRDEKNIQMAKQYPNSKHFLTYRHSLRSYASILYLRIPPQFRIILRGKDVEHHNIVNDMMLTEKSSYRPQFLDDGKTKVQNMVADLTVGFVKDAYHHINIQGFSVYHNNRLIKPFWRVWNAAGSGGRGVIGAIEANFVEPTHDKQDFEHTPVLSRLEARLQATQKRYWHKYSARVGYCEKGTKNVPAPEGEKVSGFCREISSLPLNRRVNGSSEDISVSSFCKEKSSLPLNQCVSKYNSRKIPSMCSDKRSSPAENATENRSIQASAQTSRKSKQIDETKQNDASELTGGSHLRTATIDQNEFGFSKHDREDATKKEEYNNHNKRLQEETERRKELELQLQKANEKVNLLEQENEELINIFAEERERREAEEEKLRMKLKVASNTINELLDKVRHLQSQ